MRGKKTKQYFRVLVLMQSKCFRDRHIPILPSARYEHMVYTYNFLPQKNTICRYYIWQETCCVDLRSSVWEKREFTAEKEYLKVGPVKFTKLPLHTF